MDGDENLKLNLIGLNVQSKQKHNSGLYIKQSETMNYECSTQY